MHTHDNEPAEFLIENIHLLPRGKVLDIAMGDGRNAIYMASMGFNVEGVDISEDAVNAANEHAKMAGVHIVTKVADLEDNYPIEKNTYDVIICFHYLQRSLMGQIKDALKSGGIIVYETFTVDQAQFGKPRNPDHLLKYNELLEYFRDFRCLRYREGILPGPTAVAGIVAEKI